MSEFRTRSQRRWKLSTMSLSPTGFIKRRTITTRLLPFHECTCKQFQAPSAILRVQICSFQYRRPIRTTFWSRCRYSHYTNHSTTSKLAGYSMFLIEDLETIADIDISDILLASKPFSVLSTPPLITYSHPHSTLAAPPLSGTLPAPTIKPPT